MLVASDTQDPACPGQFLSEVCNWLNSADSDYSKYAVRAHALFKICVDEQNGFRSLTRDLYHVRHRKVIGNKEIEFYGLTLGSKGWRLYGFEYGDAFVINHAALKRGEKTDKEDCKKLETTYQQFLDGSLDKELERSNARRQDAIKSR